MKWQWRMIRKLSLVIVTVVALSGILLTGTALAQGPEDGPGRDRPPRLVREILGTIADTLGLTPEELLAALRDGQRLPEIAEAQGVELADIAEAVYQEAVARVNQALAEERLSQEQADRIIEQLTARRDACVEDGQCRLLPLGKRPRPQRPVQRPDRALLEPVAEALGLTPEELLAALRDGQRLPEIAEAQGVELADIAEAVYQEAVARVNQALAEERLSQEQADRIIEQLTARRDACVEDGQCRLFGGGHPRPPRPFGRTP